MPHLLRRFSLAAAIQLAAALGLADAALASTSEEFAFIPAGSFQMGDHFNEGNSWERPVHAVNVSGFYMAKHEVTKTLWDHVRAWAVTHGYTDLPLGSHSNITSYSKGPEHPVHMVSWYAVVKWCNARSEMEGYSPCYTFNGGAVYRNGSLAPDCNWSASGYRLPSEAEWEKAARGGPTGRRFPWGDTITHAQANYYSVLDLPYDLNPSRDYHPTYKVNLMPFTAPVGRFGANGYGVFDTAGNVWEWCWDRWSPTYFETSAGTDPRGPTTGTQRVGKGGGWHNSAADCRTAYRFPVDPEVADFIRVGFRLARNHSNPLPIIFIPGIAGSMLTGGSETGKHGNGEYLWPTAGAQDIRALALGTGTHDVRPVGVVRAYDPSDWLPDIPFILETLVVYGPLLDHLTRQLRYRSFDLDERPERLGNNYLLDQGWSSSDAPTLFEFPYDWRLSNASHVATLHQYITRIRQLHGGSKVNVIAHSMGGLLLRRYATTSNYGTGIHKAVTIGSPFWGSPKAVYRMLTGEFYDSPVDWDTSGDMKAALRSMASTAELLPPFSAGHVSGRTRLLGEEGWDLNAKNGSTENYSPADFWSYVNSIAPGFQATNAAFHNSTQDDWSADAGSTAYLHIYGDVRRKGNPTTTAEVRAFEHAWDNNRGGFNRIRGYREIFGPGDNVVPVPSAILAGHAAPNSEILCISADTSDPGENSNPAKSTAEHTEMTKNPRAWNKIADFFGVASATTPPAAVASTAAAASSGATKRITIFGTGYVPISDGVGNQNTRLSDIAIKKIPGVEIRYDSQNSFIEIQCAAETELLLGGDHRTDDLDVVLHLIDGAGQSSMTRHRFSAEDQKWRLTFGAEVPTLMLDANRDGAFAAGEVLAPLYHSNVADLAAPTVTLTLNVAGGAIFAAITATDDSGFASIRYALDGGVPQQYLRPVSILAGETRHLEVIAEDAAGNTSGLIETAVNPVATVASAGARQIIVKWPVADGYYLEHSPDLSPASWSPVNQPVTRNEFTDSVSISINNTETSRFYRLRSRSVTK